jgi:hypothetical protein
MAWPPDAQAQNQPASQPPIVNQGPGSAFSYGQQGGQTIGTYIAPKPQSRHLTTTEAGDIKTNLQSKTSLAVLVIDAGGEEPRGLANDLRTILAGAGATVSNLSIDNATPPFYGIQILKSSPAEGREIIRSALASAGLSIDVTEGILPIPLSIQSRFAGMTVLIVGLHLELRMK